MKQISQMSISELIDQFENDILYYTHSLQERIRRSPAREELDKRKEEAIPMIQAHLKERRGSTREDVRHAWNIILGWMQPGQTAGSNLTKWLVEGDPAPAPASIRGITN